MTKEHALKWMQDKTTNPLTGRKLKENGATYNRLDRRARLILGMKKEYTRDRCSKTWIKLTSEEASEYGEQVVIPCKNCKEWTFLHAVHTDEGEYFCDRCDKPVDILYFCYHCKNVTRN